MIHAAHMGHLRCIKLLLDDVKKRAERENDYVGSSVSMQKAIETRTKAPAGMTALLRAAKAGKKDCVEELLHRNADINARDLVNYTRCVSPFRAPDQLPICRTRTQPCTLLRSPRQRPDQ